MKFASTIFLCLIVAIPAYPQTKPIVHLEAEIEFDESHEDQIQNYKLNDDGNTLTLVGKRTVRRLNLATKSLSTPVQIPLPVSDEDHARLISPNGHWLLVFGNSMSHRRAEKINRPASIWDLQTGKQVVVFDKTKEPVRSGWWSRNGETLVTSSDRDAPSVNWHDSVEISFWDGETFAFQNSLPSNNVSWFYLTNDGSRCFYAVGHSVSLWILDKRIDFGRGPINVWDLKSGKVTAALSISNAKDGREISEIGVSPDERHLALVFRVPYSKKPRSSFITWDIGEENHRDVGFPKKAALRGVSFSSDSKSVAVYRDDALLIFDVETGVMKKEILALQIGSLTWLAHDQTLLIDYSFGLNALDIAEDHTLYKRPLVYRGYNTFDSAGKLFGTEITDSTVWAINPKQDLILTFSKQGVDLFDSTSGKIVQMLVSPPFDSNVKKPRWNPNSTVLTAGWTGDGTSIFVISAPGNSISLWRPPGDDKTEEFK